jgi:urocanate hydratase
MATVFLENLRSFELVVNPAYIGTKVTKIFCRGKIPFNTGILSVDLRDSYPAECKAKDRFPLCLGSV